MSAYEVRQYVNGYLHRFTLQARNTATDEERTVTVYAKDGTSAYAKAFDILERDLPEGQRPWAIFSFVVD